MRNLRLALLGVVVLAAVISIIQGIVRFSHRGPGKAPASLEHQPPGIIGYNAGSAKTQQAKSPFQDWGRNPFTFEESMKEKISGIFLTGIAWDAKKPQAVVNGRIVEAGDKLAGYRVVAIKQTSIILDDGSENIEIKLGRTK